MSDWNLNSPVMEYVEGRRYRPKVRRGLNGRYQKITPLERAGAGRGVVNRLASRIADKLSSPSVRHLNAVEGDYRVGSQSGRYTVDLDTMRQLPRSQWGDYIAGTMDIDYGALTFGDSWMSLDSGEAP